ncbi:MAG: helix-turn-helix domain-containing protein [Woeseiaceae bacterium]|nr:helix-turn-helix domain-containing protein [Woeseiaceae bacterium]
MSTYLVKRLEQAKLLTDPFKLKLIERFAGDPATTKQVADRMGEKAPRLYRHVDALVEEGLLVLVEERPKRGTVERYYRTVADRFEVDPDLFATGSESADEAADMLQQVFRDVESEFVRVFLRERDAGTDPEDLPMAMRVAVRGTPDEIRELRDKLDEWLQHCGSMCGDRKNSDELVSWSGFVAFFPQQDE